MKHLHAAWQVKFLLAVMLFGFSFQSITAQTSNPKGLYKLTEVVHQDGKHVEANFRQYKLGLDSLALMFSYRPGLWDHQPFSFTIYSNKPMVYTGELSKTENKGVQIFDVTDSTFTLRWFNDMSAFNEVLFPYQTNSDELYVQVRDSSDAIQRALNLLQMKLGAKTHLLQGAWKLRGTQPDNNAASQYWIKRSPRDIYQIFGSQEYVYVYANARFPKGSMECEFWPCTYLSDNAFELYDKTFIVHWFNRDAISITSIDDTGHPIVTVWDRCGLPQNIQKTFGTDTPVMTTDISRFYTDGFKEKYGVLPDSICKAFETFDYCVDANERNNAIFPVLMRNGFEVEYKAMKDSLLSRLMQGKINVEEAVGRYAFWFYKNFDHHTRINSEFFWKLKKEVEVDYPTLIPKSAPEPVGCKVDAETYLLRLPSCKGIVPTWDWLEKKEQEFRLSGCKYLILDLRGNGGGGDEYSTLFTAFMCDGSGKKDLPSYYRNSMENYRRLKDLCKAAPGNYTDQVKEEALRTEEGSLINWYTIKKRTEPFTPLVRKGAIIIDNWTGSAAETPIQMVRNFSLNHAKVYGREHTNGSDQTGNFNTVRLPYTNITLDFPMTVDEEFEKTCLERNPGYKPDVIIPLPYPKQLTDNIDEWVLWVAKKMKK